VTVTDILQAAVSAGLARLDAQLLLLHVLGQAPIERAWLLAHGDAAVAAAEAARFTALAKRHVDGEPLAYLTGHQAFYGLDLQVDARVLVPRPDTETLVDWALEAAPDPKATVLDLGTGSGAVALALQHTRPGWSVTATDASTDALAVARANAQRLKLDVNFIHGNWLDAVGSGFDVIVSNPPYIAAGDAHLRALKDEPAMALVSGADGLDAIRQIIAQAPAHLTPGGWLLLEHGYDQAARVRDLLTQAGFERVQSRRDLGGIERCSGGQISS
jgi:release factor glutamine methyltransferase